MLLSVLQGFIGHHIKLNMVAAQLAFRAHQGNQILLVLFRFQQRGAQFHIQQIATAGFGVIHGADRLDNGGGAILIIAGIGRHTVGQGRSRFAARGQRAGDLAMGHIGDHGHIAGHKVVSQQVLVRRGDFIGEIHHLLGNVIHIRIVVAVLGGVVDQHLALSLVSLKVRLNHANQLIHGEHLVFIHQLFHRRHGVCQVRQAGGFQTGAVVEHRAAEETVGAAFQASLRQNRTNGFGKLFHVRLLGHMDAGHGHFDLVGHLLFHGVLKFFIGIKGARIAGLQADIPLPVAGVAIEQSPFHSNGITVAAALGPHVGLARRIGLDAAAHRPVIGLLQRHAAALQNTEGIFVKEQGGLTGTQLDQIADLHQILVGRFFIHAHIDGGRIHPQIHGALQHHGGKVVDRVFALFVHAAHGNAAERNITGIVGRAVRSDHINILRQLDPQAFQQFLGFQLGDGAAFDIRLIEGIQILIRAGNAACLLVFIGPDHHLGKPHRLHRLVEVSGRLIGSAAGFCDFQQLRRSHGIRFRRRQFPGIIGMTLAHNAAGLAGDDHGLIKLGLAPGLGIGPIQGSQIGLRLFTDTLKALFHHNVVIAHRPFAAAGGRLGVAEHNIGAHADVFQLIAHVGIEVLFHGFAFPEGENHFLQGLFRLLGDLVGVLGAGRHGIHLISNPLIADLGADHGGAVLRSLGADDQLVPANDQGLFRHVRQQRFRVANRQILRFRFLIDPGIHQGTKHIQFRLILEKLIPQAVHPLCRTVGPFSSFHIVVAAASHNCASFILISMLLWVNLSSRCSALREHPG